MGSNNSKVQELEQELEQIKKEREQSISLIQAKIDANNKLRQQNIEKEQLAIEEQKRADELAAKEALAIQEATIKKYNEIRRLPGSRASQCSSPRDCPDTPLVRAGS